MKINLEKNEQLEIEHFGSIRKLIVSVDDYDDICFNVIKNV